MDQELLDWVKKNSKSLTIEDGESVEVAYHGKKIGVNPFDQEKEIVFYRVELIIADQAMFKVFKSASLKAARFFAEVEIGSRVKITRHGTGTDTRYEYEEIGGTKRVEDKVDEEEIPI